MRNTQHILGRPIFWAPRRFRSANEKLLYFGCDERHNKGRQPFMDHSTCGVTLYGQWNERKGQSEAWNVTDSGRRVPPQSEMVWLHNFWQMNWDGDVEEARVRARLILHSGTHADHRQLTQLTHTFKTLSGDPLNSAGNLATLESATNTH